MKVLHAITMVLALAVLAGPLGGCRYFKKNSTAQPQPQVGTVVRRGPSTAPVMRSGSPTYVSSRPAPPTAPPTNWGSPDAPMAMSGTPAFPAPVPSDFPTAEPVATGSGTLSAIIAERESRQQLDQQIVALEEKLRKAEQAFAAAPPAAPSAPMATAAGGDSQAAHFAALMKSRAGDVEQKGSLVIVRFSDAFQSGSEKLKHSTGITSGLLAAANELSKTPGVQIQVVGHSDGQPLNKSKKRWGTNVNLSRERAQTVATELSKNGVPASRIGVDGRGSVEPLVFPEKTDKDRARNRRVEIHVRF